MDLLQNQKIPDAVLHNGRAWINYLTGKFK